MRWAVPVDVRMARQAKVPSDKEAVAQQHSEAAQVDRVGMLLPSWALLESWA